jgi:hypothetical protein
MFRINTSKCSRKWYLLREWSTRAEANERNAAGQMGLTVDTARSIPRALRGGDGIPVLFGLSLRAFKL